MFRAPDMNPIRFYQDRKWDRNVYFPSEENLPSSISGQNIGTVIYQQPWATDNKLEFQLHQELDTNIEVRAYLNGVESIISPVDITPTGWAGFGNFVMKYNFTPTSIGCLYFVIKEEVSTNLFEYHKSDEIKVKTSLPDCVRIVYYNSDNLLNAVFVKDSVRVFYPVIYLKATNNEPLIGGEYSVSITPSQVLRRLRSSPASGEVLAISLVPKALVKKIQMVMSCDNMTVNGILLQSKDVPVLDPIKGSNANNVNVDIWKTDWNYVQDYIPVYDKVPPDCGISNDLQFWFKKSGATYVDQLTGYTINEVGGRLDFNPQDPPPPQNTVFEIFNRNNHTIQDSDNRDDYDPSLPYSYGVSYLNQKGFSTIYEDGYAGRVYVRGNGDEIVVYKTDKTLACDAAALAYVFADSFVQDGGENMLINNKYNLIYLPNGTT